MAVNFAPPHPWSGRIDTEDGPSVKRLHNLEGDSGPIGILGFACDVGVIRNKGRAGAAQGPKSLRKAMSNLAAAPDSQEFVDHGDIEVTDNDLELGQRKLGEVISKKLQSHKRMVVLGGGHETAFGSYLGLAAAFPDKRIGIVNLDAHLDLRLTGSTGASSGTPFTQIRNANPDNFDYVCLGVASESNTLALFERANEWNVSIISDHALLNNPDAAKIEIDKLSQRSDLIYLTIDIDVMPAYQAPGVSAPATRGIPLQTIEHIIETVTSASKKCTYGLPLADLVELSPPHDINQITARSAAFLARRLMII